MTVLAEIRGGFSVSPKYFGGFTWDPPTAPTVRDGESWVSSQLQIADKRYEN